MENGYDQFHQAVEQDENNAKAWNALGICFSKLGEYENAGTCYENALMLDPGNTTYEKNLDKNNQKIPIKPPDINPRKTAPRQAREVHDPGYQRNWFQIPLYFIPMILAIVNPIVGFLAVILCAYYIKRDAESINAGMNPDASLWGKMKGWEWMVLLILFWILLPLYSWKREQIYRENLGHGPNYYIPQTSGLPLGKIAIGVFGVFFILFFLAFVVGMMGSVTSSGGGSASPPSISSTEIINQAKVIPYDSLARYPEQYKGQSVRIRGQVSQVINSFGGVNIRLFSKQSEYSDTMWIEDDIFIDYPSPKERILEKDIITIYGIADGIQEYTTVLGAQRSIPKIKAITHTR